MNKISMPEELRKCPHCKEFSLNYYHEGVINDIYYCSSCFGIASWDGYGVGKMEGEAYPNRDLSRNGD
jgi:hypothetical protein